MRNRTIAYIENLPVDSTVNDIFFHFGKYGRIIKLKFLSHYIALETGELEYPTGIAILQYEQSDFLRMCIEDKNPIIIAGHIVDKYDSPESIKTRIHTSAFIFFRSLYDSYEKIFEKFSQFNIVSCQILHQVQYGRPGMAIIQFKAQKDREIAMSKYSTNDFMITLPLYSLECLDFEDQDEYPSFLVHPDTFSYADSRSFKRWYDFEIKHLDVSYYVNSFLASSFSNKVKDLIVSKPSSPQSFSLVCDVQMKGPFEFIAKSLMGHEIHITTQNAVFLLLCANDLKMEQLSKACLQVINDISQPEMIFIFAGDLSKYGLDYSYHVKQIVERFDIFKDNQLFRSLPYPVLTSVFEHLPQSTIESPIFADWLMNFVGTSAEARARLIKYLPFQKMDGNKVRNILSQPGINMNHLRDSIARVIQQGIDPEEARPIEEIIRSYSKSSASNGIFSYIKERFGLPASQIIEVTSTTDLPNLVDPTWNKYWASSIMPGMWLCFDVDARPRKISESLNDPQSLSVIRTNSYERKLKVTAYTLKTATTNDVGHLKSWVLEGSNDKQSWKVMDQQTKSSLLKGPGKVSTFSVSHSEPFKYIRIRQTDRNTSENDAMYLQAVELFGELYEGPNLEKRDVYRYEKGKEWSGFFDFLSRRCGSNPVYSKEISIFSACSPCYLADLEWKGYWCTANTPNSFVSFKFPGMRISIEVYILQSSTVGKNYLTTWVLEGSNDGMQWTIIDEQKGRTELCSPGAKVCFPCKPNKHYSHIRIKQSGCNKAGTHNLFLAHVEFFGSIRFFD